MQQVVCPKCKVQADASLNFCPGCGSPLPLPNSRGAKPGEKLTQVNQQHVAKAILNEGKRKENPKAAFAVGLITIVLVVGIIAFLILSSGGSSTPTVADSIANASTIESSSPESSADAVIPAESSEASMEESSMEASLVESSMEASLAESSIEESLVESYVEESSAEVVAADIVITAEKPDDWSDIYAYVYTDDMFKNADWPGEAMTDNGDGTFSYSIPNAFAEKNTFVVFSTTQLNKDAVLSKQFPYMSDNGYALNEKSSFTVSDFEAYADEKAA